MADIKEREVSRKFTSAGDREYIKSFVEGRENADCQS
jgi:hypothetical protein